MMTESKSPLVRHFQIKKAHLFQPRVIDLRFLISHRQFKKRARKVNFLTPKFVTVRNLRRVINSRSRISIEVDFLIEQLIIMMIFNKKF